MYVNPVLRMKKIHIWLGVISQVEEEYLEYFNQDDNLSQFSEDIGIEEYDEDFIGILPLFPKAMDVREILENEVPIDSTDVQRALEQSAQLKIEKANAVLYLTDASVEIDKPYKENYNGLKYIGVFNSSL